MKVLVIGGGISDERDISLKSARAILEAARTAGNEADFYDWDGSSEWLMANAKVYEVILPILHGPGGEDGLIQSIIEKTKVPYLGTDAAASAVCMDKQRTREELMKSGVRIPAGQTVFWEEYIVNPLSDKGHVVKPLSGGSSIDTHILPDGRPSNLADIHESFIKHGTLLIEEFISGPEITVPVLHGKLLPVIEIIPPENEFFDLENKYNGKTKELIPPKSISKHLQTVAQDLARQVHDIMHARHLSRVDMIVQQDELVVLEINTIPGMTNQSLFPLAAKHAGMDMPALVEYLIKLCLEVK